MSKGMDRVDLSGMRHKPRHSTEFPYARARKLQDAAIEKVSELWKLGYKYVFLEAPTGFGKSAVAVTLARENPKSYILVSSKPLQDQYARDKSFRTIHVKGRSNFRCLLSEAVSCDKCLCNIGAQCDHKPGRSSEGDEPVDSVRIAHTPRDSIWMKKGNKVCRYWDQKCRALNHDYPVMNYSYFLHETTYARDFGRRKSMICDEAHNLEDSLMSFIQFSVSDRDLKPVRCRLPRRSISAAAWARLMSEWAEAMKDEARNLEKSMREASSPQRKQELLESMQDACVKAEKCGFMAGELGEDPDNWVIGEETKGVRKVNFKPIFVRKWAGKFFGMADRFLLQSATIIDADSMAGSLGLEPDDCISVSAPSDFDPANRPVFYNPMGSMSRGNIDASLPELVQEIAKLLKRYPYEKGVIHTHTYRIQDFILRALKTKRFVANKDAVTRDSVIREFVESRKPLVLVTPSAYEGMDFKHDICRWQVICKVPYPDMGDLQVQRRMELDPRWYRWKSVLRLVQTYGRGTRSEVDWCDTFLFDSSFGVLFRDSRDIMPEWFMESLRQVG